MTPRRTYVPDETNADDTEAERAREQELLGEFDEEPDGLLQEDDEIPF